MFNYRQALVEALKYPGQVKYEIDSYDYYFQEELNQTVVPNFHINKKIHGVYPVFGEKFRYFKQTSEALYRIFEKVAEERHKEINEGLDTFDFLEFEQRLIKHTPKSGKLIRHIRLDVIYSPSYKNLKVLECNPENPGGIWDNDFAVNCMTRNRTRLYEGIFAANGDFGKIKHHKQKERLINSLIHAYRDMFGEDPKTIAIGLFPEDDSAFIAHCEANYFRSLGFESLVVNPAEFRYENGKVYVGDKKIDVLFRGFLMEEIRQHIPRLEAMASAYENDDICIVPPFSDALISSKTLMAEIPTRYSHLLTEEEKELIEDIFPEAVVVTPENYDEIMNNVMDKVVKAGEGYGGFGVIVGRQSYDKKLPDLEEIQKRPYISQKYYPHETIKCPYIDNGNVSIETVNVVLGNLVILGEYTGTLVRGSLSDVINTHQGAEILTSIDEDHILE
ncbi:MAG: hypothetical protein B6244_05735 [Candidatus Cloacimonetes bacterium 4572_55]|nr:MAG: hypothetical protein B6244_05735 [Candidatus Cloacimonetes bacterium 4572_55]